MQLPSSYVLFSYLEHADYLKMKGLLSLCFVSLFFLKCSEAGFKTKCQVVNALRNEGVPNSDLRNCKYVFVYFLICVSVCR